MQKSAEIYRTSALVRRYDPSVLRSGVSGRNGESMGIDVLQFERAKERVIGKERERQGIGTLSEKTLHAVLKHYYAPDTDMHEIPVGQFVADIYTGSEIIEIQTRSFNSMRRKLEAFLPLHPVTIVYPVPRIKYLSWIDEETGEASPKRKSPKRGNAYEAFTELYKIRPFLSSGNLRFRFALIDMQEYRLLNGWSRDKKRGATRYDRIPVALVDEMLFERVEDYRMMIPPELSGFTSKEYAKSVKIPLSHAQTAMNIFHYLELVERVGKKGNAYIYEVKE